MLILFFSNVSKPSNFRDNKFGFVSNLTALKL